jgi:hypothetical protein
MANIILQHFDGELRELDKLSIDNISKYAKFVDADYKLVTGKPFNKYLTAPCQKVHMISEEFDEYDQVLMLDIDMFTPIGMTDNVFNEQGVGLYADVQKRLHRNIVKLYPFIARIDKPYWGGAIYKMDRNMRQQLRSVVDKNAGWLNNYNKPYHFEDEGIFHTLSVLSDLRLKENEKYLSQRWCQCSFLPNPEKAGFIHIRTKITPTGPKREKIENYKALVNGGIL